MQRTQKRRPGGGGADPTIGGCRVDLAYHDTAPLSIIAEIDRRMSVAWLAGLAVRR